MARLEHNYLCQFFRSEIIRTKSANDNHAYCTGEGGGTHDYYALLHTQLSVLFPCSSVHSVAQQAAPTTAQDRDS